jgi:DNA repair protein RadD
VCCGFEFLRTVNLVASAGTGQLIAGVKEVQPPVRVEVQSVKYTRHRKQGKPDSVKVTYQCGLRLFSEWVCPEHPGFAGNAAARWWLYRSDAPTPMDTAEFLQRVETLREPKAVFIQRQEKHDRVIDYDFNEKQ